MRLVMVLPVVALLAACGGGSGSEPESLADEVGCDTFEPAGTEEMFVQERFTCDETDVYTFESSGDRDSWREIAEGFGTAVVSEGDTWLQVD